MKITEQSESRLVVRSSSASGLVGGASLLIPGILMLTYVNRSLVGLLVALALIGGGVAYLLAVRLVNATVDKLHTTVTVRSRSLLRATSRTEAISDVERLTTDQLYNLDGRPGLQMKVFSNIVLVYKDGSFVVLDREKGKTLSLPGGVAYNQYGNHTVEAELAQCLGVPLVVNTGDFHMAADQSMRRKGHPPRRRPPVSAPPPPADQHPATVAPGWYADPGGSHELRYWDGSAWTAVVVDRGRQSMDPLPAAP